MIFISHRGNINGPNPSLENSPGYIQQALDKGYHVEVDVWVIDKNVLLGHDEPQYSTTLDFLKNDKIICHAKNPAALALLVSENMHCFGHDKDEVVLTSKNWLWTFPGGRLTDMSIAVMPERVTGWDISNCRGVCSDYETFSTP